MKKNLTTRSKTKYIPQSKVFEKQGDRAANKLRPEYKWIVDFEGSYFCDQHGHIYSSLQTAIRVKAQHKNTRGYLRWTVNGKQKMVAREMLRAWRGECPVGYEAAHRDDVKSNNHINNLRWARRGEQGDLKRIINGTASQELYTNGSNRLDAEFNRAAKRQYETIQSHSDECRCKICELKNVPDAVPLSLRKKGQK